MPFPATQQLNLPAFSQHCLFNTERASSREAVKFEVIDLTRRGIKPESTAPKAESISPLGHLSCHTGKYVPAKYSVKIEFGSTKLDIFGQSPVEVFVFKFSCDHQQLKQGSTKPKPAYTANADS